MGLRSSTGIFFKGKAVRKDGKQGGNAKPGADWPIVASFLMALNKTALDKSRSRSTCHSDEIVTVLLRTGIMKEERSDFHTASAVEQEECSTGRPDSNESGALSFLPLAMTIAVVLHNK